MNNKLELSQGTVYGVDYYTVRPKTLYFGPEYSKQGWDDMLDWCVNTFDSPPKDGVWSPGARWYANNARLWFKDESDRAMFVLRWS
jgi:hypothetical protein